MPRTDRPGIKEVGKAEQLPDRIKITGWSLTLCSAACRCHRNPTNGGLAILHDPVRAFLGLISYATEPCSCCEPWRGHELLAVLRDLAAVDNLTLEGS